MKRAAGMLAVFLLALAASAEDIFSGRSYRMTEMFMDGRDIMPMVQMAGGEVVIVFGRDGTLSVEYDLGSFGGWDFETPAPDRGTYSVDAERRELVLAFGGEGHGMFDETYRCPYTADGDTFRLEEGGTGATFTAVEIAPSLPAPSAFQDDTAGNERVTAASFAGKSYRLSRIMVNGVDISAFFTEDDARPALSIAFADERTVRVTGEAAIDGDSAEAPYTVDVRAQTITVHDDDTGNDMVFRYLEGGALLKLVVVDGDPLALGAEPDGEGITMALYLSQE